MSCRFACSAALAAMSIMTAPSVAQPHVSDVILDHSDGQVTTNRFEAGNLIEECVFEMVLNSNSQANDPGFDSEAGAFPSNAFMGPNIRKALRVWENDNFDTIPDEQIEIRWGPLGPVTSPLTDTIVDGSLIGLGVGGNGQFHNHYIFTLTSPATDGVYLLELEFWISPASLATSRPFWLVIATDNADAQMFADAVDYVRENIAWCTESCLADWDGNGLLNTGDFLAYLNDYNAVLAGGSPIFGDPDLAPPLGVVNTADFLAFLNAYVAGCP